MFPAHSDGDDEKRTTAGYESRGDAAAIRAVGGGSISFVVDRGSTLSRCCLLCPSSRQPREGPPDLCFSGGGEDDRLEDLDLEAEVSQWTQHPRADEMQIAMGALDEETLRMQSNERLTSREERGVFSSMDQFSILASTFG